MGGFERTGGTLRLRDVETGDVDLYVRLRCNPLMTVGCAEVGWMVLPEHQGRGVAKAAVLLLLAREQQEQRWGPLHAFTSTANVASNALCRSLPFRLVGEESYVFVGHEYPVTHWMSESTASGGRATS